MKRIITILLIITLITVNCISAMAYPQPQTRLFVNGNEVLLGQEPYNVNGRMYIQADILAPALGVKYQHSMYYSGLALHTNTHFITTQIGTDVVLVNSLIQKGMDNLATYANGVLMLSVRTLAECIGMKVEWNDAERAIYITSVNPGNNAYDLSDNNSHQYTPYNQELEPDNIPTAAPKDYPACDIPDFGTFSDTDCDFSETITENDGSSTYTYKYIVSRYNMYSSGIVHNYLNELIRRGWVTDGKQYEVPEKNMMYYYFEKNNCHAAVSLMRDAEENTYTLWVTYSIY